MARQAWEYWTRESWPRNEGEDDVPTLIQAMVKKATHEISHGFGAQQQLNSAAFGFLSGSSFAVQGQRRRGDCN